jgi:hypothetical protein
VPILFNQHFKHTINTAVIQNHDLGRHVPSL